MIPRAFLGQGYFLRFRSPSEAGASHTFCGPCTVPDAACPNCAEPLLQFVKLDLRDARLGLPDFPTRDLSLLFCWRCQVAQAPFAYRVLPSGQVELLRYGKGRDGYDFPYDDYPVAFPAAAFDLLPLTAAQQSMIADLNAGQEIYPAITDGVDPIFPRHQIGGEPYLVQHFASAPDCPKCKAELPLLAAIGDETIDGRGFTGNAFVQVLYFLCAKCAIVAAYQTCD